MQKLEYTQWVFTYSKSTIKTLEQGNVIYSKLTKKKRHWNDLIDIKKLRNIDVTLVSLLLNLKRFQTFP